MQSLYLDIFLVSPAHEQLPTGVRDVLWGLKNISEYFIFTDDRKVKNIDVLIKAAAYGTATQPCCQFFWPVESHLGETFM